MNRKQKLKIVGIVTSLILLSCACGLILFALKQNINLFYTPTQLSQATLYTNQTIRLGGYVKNHSVHYDMTGTSVRFTVTDRSHEITIIYQGVLPNLFREGQTVVVTGKLNKQNLLVANEVLAKHDEKYMPSAIANELKAEENAS